jgi:hypothetical protein
MFSIGWPAPLVGAPGLGPGSNTWAAVETPAGKLVSTPASLAVVVVVSVVVNVVNVEVVVDVLPVVSVVVVVVPGDVDWACRTVVNNRTIIVAQTKVHLINLAVDVFMVQSSFSWFCSW